MLIYLNIFSHQRIHNSKYCVHNLIQGRHQMSYRQYLGSYQDLKEMKICKETAEKSSNNNKVFQQFVQVMNNYFSNVTVIKHQFCHKRKSIYKLSCASSSCNWSTNIPSFYYFDLHILNIKKFEKKFQISFTDTTFLLMFVLKFISEIIHYIQLQILKSNFD